MQPHCKPRQEVYNPQSTSDISQFEMFLVDSQSKLKSFCKTAFKKIEMCCQSFFSGPSIFSIETAYIELIMIILKREKTKKIFSSCRVFAIFLSDLLEFFTRHEMD